MVEKVLPHKDIIKKMLIMSGQHYCRLFSIICQQNGRTISSYFIGGDNLIYEKVLSLAADRGMSISELEKKAGLSKASISKWKKSSPTAGNLGKNFCFHRRF